MWYLEFCFWCASAFTLLSSGKVVVNLLDKPVVVHPLVLDHFPSFATGLPFAYLSSLCLADDCWHTCNSQGSGVALPFPKFAEHLPVGWCFRSTTLWIGGGLFW